MTLINRIMIGTFNGSTSLFAVYDPFFDAIQIEINGRSFTSWDRPTQNKVLREATQYADDLRHLLVTRYDFVTDKAYGMYTRCIEDMHRTIGYTTRH